MESSPTHIVLISLSILLLLANHCCCNQTSGREEAIQNIKDEFNTTETLSTIQQREHSSLSTSQHFGGRSKFSRTLRQTLMRIDLGQCCPSWRNLSRDLGAKLLDHLAEQQAARSGFYGFGRSRGKSNSADRHQSDEQQQLEPADFLDELTGVFVNITQLSIDGQQGQNEAEKYYKFYDNVQYYLRLQLVAESYLDEQPEEESGSKDAGSNSTRDTFLSTLATEFETFDQKLIFKRKLESLKFKISNDPVISGFLEELITRAQKKTIEVNRNFELYENFIKRTKFGHDYARNISMVRDSVRNFDQICQHLSRVTFPSNLTRPSKQYAMIHRMARKLFQIRYDLTHKVSARILSNRHDTKRLFQRLDELVDSRPEIRMLGDEFGDSGEALFYSKNVKLLANMLDRYTTNNMTQLTFYNELSNLPEEFILFGTQIAREYELRELPQYNRFDFDYYKPEWSNHNGAGTDRDTGNTTTGPVDARQSTNGYFLSNLLG